MAMLAEWWNLDVVTASPSRGVFRHSASDAWLVGASLVQAAITIAVMAMLPQASHLGALISTIVFGVGICWCSNTVSHNHLHNALFRRRWQNRAFSLWLTALTGIPQTIWRERHLWHHAGEPARKSRPLSRAAKHEIALVAVLALTIAAFSPRAFLFSILPGYLLGMGLCRLQGDMEHALDRDRERGISHYGAFYNFFWFNDGHHAEHHQFPSEHWTRLPARRHETVAVESAYSPHFRGLEALSKLKGRLLCALERLAIESAMIQRFVLVTHARALAAVLARLPKAPRDVVVIGGGLFPRSLLLLGKLLPHARFCVVDQSLDNVLVAIEELKRRDFDLSRVRFSIESFDPARHAEHDLLVAPLGFVGSRKLLDSANTRVPLLSHDWIWQRRAGGSRIVSWLLLKRVNLALPNE